MRIEDDRGNGVVYGAEVKSINFLNGARHSVYYKRNGANAMLLVHLVSFIICSTFALFILNSLPHLKVDRDEIPLRPLSTSIHPDGLAEVTGKLIYQLLSISC